MKSCQRLSESFFRAWQFFLIQFHLLWIECFQNYCVSQSENIWFIFMDYSSAAEPCKRKRTSPNKFKSGNNSSCQMWTLQSGSMCVYSTLSHDKLKYTQIALLFRVHVWNKFSDWKKPFLNQIFKFQNTIWDFK